MQKQPEDHKRRVDIKRILADPVKKRQLMVRAIIATQALEGRAITQECAEEVYDQVFLKKETP